LEPVLRHAKDNRYFHIRNTFLHLSFTRNVTSGALQPLAEGELQP